MRRKQINIRVEEVQNLMDTFFEQGFLKNECSFDDGAQMEYDKLTIGGHSFGGMTALAVSHRDARIKATFGFDAWTWCINDQIADGTFKMTQPQIQIITQNFLPALENAYDYKGDEVVKKMLEQSTNDDRELIILNETNHGHQCDAILLITLEGFLMTMDSMQLNYLELYMLNTQCVLQFLSRIGFSNCYDTAYIEKYV